MSNPYNGSTGKSHLAMDECLELSNRFYTQFPLVKTMEAFACQANYIGMAKMSKRFMNIMMAMKSINDINFIRFIFKSTNFWVEPIPNNLFI